MSVKLVTPVVPPPAFLPLPLSTGLWCAVDGKGGELCGDRAVTLAPAYLPVPGVVFHGAAFCATHGDAEMEKRHDTYRFLSPTEQMMTDKPSLPPPAEAIRRGAWRFCANNHLAENANVITRCGAPATTHYPSWQPLADMPNYSSVDTCTAHSPQVAVNRAMRYLRLCHPGTPVKMPFIIPVPYVSYVNMSGGCAVCQQTGWQQFHHWAPAPGIVFPQQVCCDVHAAEESLARKAMYDLLFRIAQLHAKDTMSSTSATYYQVKTRLQREMITTLADAMGVDRWVAQDVNHPEFWQWSENELWVIQKHYYTTKLNGTAEARDKPIVRYLLDRLRHFNLISEVDAHFAPNYSKMVAWAEDFLVWAAQAVVELGAATYYLTAPPPQDVSKPLPVWQVEQLPLVAAPPVPSVSSGVCEGYDLDARPCPQEAQFFFPEYAPLPGYSRASGKWCKAHTMVEIDKRQRLFEDVVRLHGERAERLRLCFGVKVPPVPIIIESRLDWRCSVNRDHSMATTYFPAWDMVPGTNNPGVRTCITCAEHTRQARHTQFLAAVRERGAPADFTMATQVQWPVVSQVPPPDETLWAYSGVIDHRDNNGTPRQVTLDEDMAPPEALPYPLGQVCVDEHCQHPFAAHYRSFDGVRGCGYVAPVAPFIACRCLGFAARVDYP